jgi:hypothetical protein
MTTTSESRQDLDAAGAPLHQPPDQTGALVLIMNTISRAGAIFALQQDNPTWFSV